MLSWCLFEALNVIEINIVVPFEPLPLGVEMGKQVLISWRHISEIDSLLEAESSVDPFCFKVGSQ